MTPRKGRPTLDEQLEASRVELSWVTKDRDDLRSENDSQRSAIAGYQVMLARRDDRIDRLNAEIASQRATISQLHHQGHGSGS